MPIDPKITADVKTAEKAVSGWRLNGWAALGLMLLANVAGCVFHI